MPFVKGKGQGWSEDTFSSEDGQFVAKCVDCCLFCLLISLFIIYDFNNMFLCRFKCSLKTSFLSDLITSGVYACDSFLLN